jgi:signal transduction histidine kinase/CheY-like chemotaxis protein/uncharacterized protein HemY
MNKFKLLVSIGLLFTGTVWGNQTNTPDSLLWLLNQAAKNDKVEFAEKLCNYYASTNFDSAHQYCDLALSLCKSNPSKKKKGQLLKTKGNIFFRQGNYNAAEQAYKQALKIFSSDHQAINEAKIHNNLGLLHQIMGRNIEAMANLEKAMAIYKNSHHELLETGPLINIGLILFRSGDYKNAAQKFKQALSIAEAHNDIEVYSNVINNLGAVYKEWGKYTEALELYQKAIQNYTQSKDDFGRSVSHYNLGVLYEELGDYNQAIEHVLKSLQIKQNIQANGKIAVSLNKLGDLYCAWNKKELALDYYYDALERSKNNANIFDQATALSGIAKIFAMNDMYKKALDYLNQAILLFEQIDSKKEVAELNCEIGLIYANKLNNPQKALSYFSNAEYFFTQVNSQTGMANLHYYKGQSLYFQKKYNEAIKNFTKSIEIMPFNNHHLHNNYVILADCFEKVNAPKKAIDAYKKALSYKDSIMKEHSLLQTEKLEIQHSIQKKEQEIEILKKQSAFDAAQLKKNTLMQLTLFIFSFLLLASLAYILVFTFKMKKAYTKLHTQQGKIESQKKDLQDANLKLIEARIQAEKLADFKSQFLANISHEIRTPLNAIMGYAKLMENKSKNEGSNSYLNNIIQASDNLSIIINDLLDFSKIEAGKMILESIAFKPLEIITQAISTLKFKAEEKNISLEIHINPSLPRVLKGDPNRLSQILINLISNAIKFSNQNQNISIEVDCEKHQEICQLKFSVTDQGIGIDENKLESIFESFTQAQKDTSRFYGGTGLGLAIVKRLVTLQKGTIQVTSKPNSGSCFSLSIPYPIERSIPEEHLDQSKTIQKKALKTDQSIQILLVEDNIINQELAKDTIISWKEPMNVDIAENGQEAIDALKQKHYDLILMDIQMPVMDGHEATLYIRTQMEAPINKIPIIGMTAHAFTSEKELALKNGMNEYIIKPFNPEELKQKIIYFATR